MLRKLLCLRALRSDDAACRFSATVTPTGSTAQTPQSDPCADVSAQGKGDQADRVLRAVYSAAPSLDNKDFGPPAFICFSATRAEI